MCGIAGIVCADGARVAAALSCLVACQRHRGPDDEGFEIVDFGDAAVGFGQRRLSILDLSPAGHQPMIHPDTGDVLVFNGEIYNAEELAAPLRESGVRFRGHSDTEVVLHGLARWGPEWLSRLAGMYAIAFLERRSRRLLLARDPMGIKPLYTAERPGALLFASEVRPILATGLVAPEVDPAGLAGLLAHGAVPEPLTFFKGVRAFEPGQSRWHAIGRGGEIRAEKGAKHWSFPTIDERIDERDAVARLRAVLDVSVKEHLIADRPVGVFLSSGLDSTIVAGIARRHTPDLRTFTVGFADQPDMSESEIAAASAAAFGVRHRDLQITGDQAQASTLDWLASMDQPSVDGLNTYVISRAVREAGIVVALSGLGGDELFGGYSSFADVPQAMAALRQVMWAPEGLRAWAMSLAAARRSPMARERAAAMGRIGPDPLGLYLQRRRVMSDGRLAAMGLASGPLGLDRSYTPPEAVSAAREADLTDAVAAVSRYESAFYMRNMLLRDSDTNGMAHSLEIRVPMLDRRVMDLAYSIPGAVRLPRGVADKHLLRAAFPELLAKPVRNQVKKGFTLPLKRWMMGPLRETCDSAMRVVKRSGLVDAAQAQRVWDEFERSPDAPGWSSALLLCVLGIYLQKVESWRAGGPDGGVAAMLRGAPRGAAALEAALAP